MPAKKAARKATGSKLKIKVKDLKSKKDTKAGAGGQSYCNCNQQIIAPRP